MHQQYKNLLQLNCLFGNEAGPFGSTVGIVCSPFWVLEVNPSVAFVPRTANVCLFSVLSPFLAGFFNACMNLALCRRQYSGGFHNRRGVCLVLGRGGGGRHQAGVRGGRMLIQMSQSRWIAPAAPRLVLSPGHLRFMADLEFEWK